MCAEPVKFHLCAHHTFCCFMIHSQLYECWSSECFILRSCWDMYSSCKYDYKCAWCDACVGLCCAFTSTERTHRGWFYIGPLQCGAMDAIHLHNGISHLTVSLMSDVLVVGLWEIWCRIYVYIGIRYREKCYTKINSHHQKVCSCDENRRTCCWTSSDKIINK